MWNWWQSFSSGQKVVWLYLLVVGLLLTFLVPPFQKPDEDYHYYQTYALVLGECKFSAVGGSMVLPQAVYNLPAQLDFGQVVNGGKFKTTKLTQTYLLTKNQTTVLHRPCMRYGWLGYWPAMVGVILGGQNLLVSFYLARLMGLVVLLAASYWAVKWAGPYWPILAAVACLPMFLHQVTAISSDSWHLTLGVLSFGAYLGLSQNPKLINFKNLVGFLSLLLAFILAKRGYYLSLGLPLILIWPLLTEIKTNLKTKLSWVVGLAAYFFLAQILIFQTLVSLEKITTPVYQPDIQQAYLINHKIEFLILAIRTTTQRVPIYFSELYGRLGFSEFELTPLVYACYAGLTVWLLTKIKLDQKPTKLPSWLELITLAGMISGTYGLILIAMFIHATPQNSPVILGVQGRYLLWPYLIWLYFLVRLREVLGGQKSIWLVGGLFLITVLISLVSTIVVRYYN